MISRSGASASTAPSASTKPSGAVQQTQPPGMFVMRKGSDASSATSSSEASPKSLTITAIFSWLRASSCARIAVVLPAPRKPEKR